MNVKQLREALEDAPDHWPVHVASASTHEHGGGADIDFLFVTECEQDNFPTQGNMVVIRTE
ncbi:MAG: hypothetical protein WBK19_10360 [Azonexus sp.]